MAARAGTKNLAHLRDIAGAADLTLELADLTEFDALPPPVGARE